MKKQNNHPSLISPKGRRLVDFFHLAIVLLIPLLLGGVRGGCQNIGINTDGSPAETGVMLDVKGTNTEGNTVAPQTLFQLKSKDADADALKLRFGFKTDGTGTNRYGFIEFTDYIVGFPSWRNLALQPSGGLIGIGTTAPLGYLDINPTYAGGSTANLFGQRSSFTLNNAAATVTNWYGSYIAVPTISAGTLTNKYALVTEANSGNVGIGTITPAEQLEITGCFRLPATTSSSIGVIKTGTIRFIHNYGTQNTFLGQYAGFIGASVTGINNTACGFSAMNGVDAGLRNTALGAAALYCNTAPYLTGSDNTATGVNALYTNTSGTGNTSNGVNALFSNTIGGSNTAIGMQALLSNVAGNNATAVGYNAMYYVNNNATSFTNYNVAVGFEALKGSVTASANTGNYNTALGYQTLFVNTTGSNNTALGFQTFLANTSGTSNTAIGTSTFRANTTGNFNVANGVNTLDYNTTGSYNVACGVNALQNNVAGDKATAVGTNAMQYANNTATGFINTSVALGYEALRGSITASNNTGIGNTALGYQSLFSMTSGNYNTASGDQALYSNSTGNDNTANGFQALYTNNNGLDNTASGMYSLVSNSSGNYNTGIGVYSLGLNSTGSENTALGNMAGFNGTAHSQCTFIGASSTLTTNRTNVTLLGYGIVNGACTGDNRIILGNTAVTGVYVSGVYTGFTSYSDVRIKTNIKDNVAGLDFILKLKPVTYNVRTKELYRIWGTPDSLMNKIDHSESEKITCIGFIAQDVEKAAKESGFSFPGIDVPRNNKEAYALRYVDFIMPMVKGMQEQQKMIESQQKQIDELKMLVEKLTTKNSSSASK